MTMTLYKEDGWAKQAIHLLECQTTAGHGGTIWEL